MNLRSLILGVFFLALSLSAASLFSAPAVADDDDTKGKPKGIYHDTMEEVEDLYGEIKSARADVEKYGDLVSVSRKMHPLFEKLIPLTAKKVKELGTAKTDADALEAKALMVESLAHSLRLEAALLKKDPEGVKAQLTALKKVKNAAHRVFQP